MRDRPPPEPFRPWLHPIAASGPCPSTARAHCSFEESIPMKKTVFALAIALAFGATAAVQATSPELATPMQQGSQMNASAMNWFGGPTYSGAPALEATAALVKAGGGATNFSNGMTFAVNAGLKRATEAGVKLPAAPADLKGAKLAEALVKAGTAPDGVWWSGYLFDVALSHDIHVGVMQDIDAKFGHGADETTHKILNQAMYDVAQALKVPNVKLASLH